MGINIRIIFFRGRNTRNHSGAFEQNRELRIGNEEKKQMTQIIEDILYAYNEYTKSLMSSGERTLHNTLSSDFSKIMDKLGVIEEQPHKENIKKFCVRLK